ncbi:MAG: hypothetical protein DI535_21670 [Citrobacter freundii]|nr:MAG: hypothetical protein DI535_21670 [Citrobacter freundii]
MCITGLWHDYCNLPVTKSETYENNNHRERLHDPVVLCFVADGITFLTFGSFTGSLRFIAASSGRDLSSVKSGGNSYYDLNRGGGLVSCCFVRSYRLAALPV